MNEDLLIQKYGSKEAAFLTACKGVFSFRCSCPEIVLAIKPYHNKRVLPTMTLKQLWEISERFDYHIQRNFHLYA